jgi:hypothetical protein
MTYYHFVRVNKDGQAYLGYADNRIITVGEPVTVEGEPVLCHRGLHASARIIDALEYCPVGDVALCRVELGGTVIHGDDKSVASERTITAILPVEKTNALLQDFARWCALQVIDLWDAPDVVREYLTTGDESLSEAARAAASTSAARAAAMAAARAARAAAAWAARDAAMAAARAAWAARDAAWATTMDAAWAAAWAARDAAWAATMDAAWAAQEAELQRLFHEAAEGSASHEAPVG